ncbi:hypothetical protein DUNSADRAFT_1944 [Dunaliella salina]|uniref:Uncharacterized protein n=1 Tax=Dunaliella salina TaxID=3046 RepID=A0ABQ7GWF0_DUNSA|nr:hypothetical protein DUNSADRAFT_1944 [Dunaliella salina]|eukprot:KAF5838928.1 hypothetical protein DUNSADRAFT_1944 [Dunaliella salina]
MPLCCHNIAVRFWSCNLCVSSLRNAASTGAALAIAAPLVLSAEQPMTAAGRATLLLLCAVSAATAVLNPSFAQPWAQAAVNMTPLCTRKTGANQ